MRKLKGEGTHWQRARRPDQVKERRDSILSATSRLIERGGVPAVGLTAIAREAGLSKANLYRYFENREAILLELFESEIAVWSNHFAELLGGLAGPTDIAAVAQATADSLKGREIYCSLFSALAPDLESRLTEPFLIRSRRSLREAFVGLIGPLRGALPHLSKSQVNEFLIMHAMFIAGIWSHATPGKALAEVMGREEFVGMRMNFLERVRWHALILLMGLESISQPRVKPAE